VNEKAELAVFSPLVCELQCVSPFLLVCIHCTSIYRSS
jgi:hypothetical protein